MALRCCSVKRDRFGIGTHQRISARHQLLLSRRHVSEGTHLGHYCFGSLILQVKHRRRKDSSIFNAGYTMAAYPTSVRAPAAFVASNRLASTRLCKSIIAHSMVESQGAVSAWPSHIIVKHAFSIEKLKKKGVPTWPTWSCEVKTFEHSYERNEDCYILQGRAVVTPDGGEPTQLVPGDYATFPVGMSASWDVQEPLRKHYRLH
ncbi:hypothetical protein COO60DRAFT_1293567 [Scenedesmus sp. NREL 46B-D3]|nr:hypothetical protein COO60DRAFT_1293567 [Scenedesmus sp. NREL 46B-D3]